MPPDDTAAQSRGLMRVWDVGRTTVSHALADGTIHAGNLAYLSIVTLFPLMILITAVMAALGSTDVGQTVIAGFLASLPEQSAQILAPVIAEVLAARTGILLWIGGIVALWTVTGFIETIRNLFHRSYDFKPARPFWLNRLLSTAGILLALLFLFVAFLSQLLLVLVLRDMREFLSQWVEIPGWLDVSRLIPPLLIFGTLWLLYKLLTPAPFRRRPSWPGALLTTLVWTLTATLLGPVISLFGGYGMTYGAFSGVMITMLFFYIVGLGLVIGAALNATLAQSHG